LLISAGAVDKGKPTISCLATKGTPIGCFEQATFEANIQSIRKGERLLLFSDGIFEIYKPDDSVGTLEEFIQELARPEVLVLRPQQRLVRAQETRGETLLEDDFSLVELQFH